MFASTLLVMFFAFAETPIAVSGEEPWIIQLSGGEVLYGFVDDGVWNSGLNTGFQVNLDAPWLRESGQRRRLTLNQVEDHRPERTAARERRYKENGYELVRSPAATLAIEKSEYDYARRSNEMAAALARERSETPFAPETESSGGEEAAVKAPGFMEQWERHIVVAVSCAVLGLIIARSLLSR